MSISSAISKGGVSALLKMVASSDDHLDLAGRELGVDGAHHLPLLLAELLAARAHRAAHADDPLGPHGLGEVVRLAGGLGVEDDLGEPVAVAQVDEDDVAVIAPARDPAEEDDLLADVGRAQIAAAVACA